MKTKFTGFYLIFIAGIIIFISTTAYLHRGETGEGKIFRIFNSEQQYDNSKLIKFDHKLHTVDAEIKCEDCHAAAVNSVSSKDNLNPKKKNCEGCHDVKDKNECGLCHYDNVY
ncbi:MAG TPA: cytochrome c3 family protein, partial [Ignavibacteria bacterium]|nr:cytochrome c3 family protein [Ignavibacteria bacterium]